MTWGKEAERKNYIETAKEIKALFRAGWELWYKPPTKNKAFGGTWEMRKTKQATRPVSVDGIGAIMKHKAWLDQNLICTDYGRGEWVYQMNQAELLN